MDKRMRTNLLLLVAAVVIALVVWLSPEREPDEGVAVFHRDAEFSRIEVQEHGDTRFVLQRQGERWRMQEPVAADADEFQLESLLANLRQPAVRSYPVEEADLAALGLDDPQWQVIVDGESLAFGQRSALGNNRYLRKGDTVYIVNDVMTYRLQRDPLDYASKRLLPQGVTMTAIELPAGQHIERDETGWQLEPEHEAVSTDTVQALADAWQYASALRLRAAETLPEGEQVIIRFENGDTLRFVAEVTDNGLTLTREQPLLRYELPRDEARRLLQLTVDSATDDSGNE